MTSHKSPAPAAPRHTGPWNEYADSTGIDVKYAQEDAEAQRQLKEATAGPGKDDAASPVAGPAASSVATGDTDMKNPHGAFATPSPYTGTHPKRPDPGVDGQSNRTPDGKRDPEGHQGGSVKKR